MLFTRYRQVEARMRAFHGADARSGRYHYQPLSESVTRCVAPTCKKPAHAYYLISRADCLLHR